MKNTYFTSPKTATYNLELYFRNTFFFPAFLSFSVFKLLKIIRLFNNSISWTIKQ